MTQIISNRTGREKIIKAEGENTEIKIIAKENEEFIHINAEIKLNKEHNFKDDYNIFLQAYESSGIAKEPWNLGTVGKTGEYAFSFKDLNIESLLFRLKIVDTNQTIKGFADEIRPSLSKTGKGVKSNTIKNSNTLLPIRESDKIRLPFSIEMSPYNKPILLVKSKHHLKEKFKWDISTKVFIYTSAIRQIITNYISDKSYSDCPVKKNFLNKVMSNAGMEPDFEEIPEYFDKNMNISYEAIEWIENLTAGCIDTPVQYKGKNVNYLKIFEDDCIRFNQEQTNEN
ncbi:hypothetical protein OAP22_02475 [Candidatus Pelagibacter ubique]|nr:hypothetical protein [Candidatus Pelagibacter ubique]